MLLSKKLFILLVFFLSLKSLAFTVVIDPGHGGQDVGALRDFSSHFFKESKMTLSLSQKIQKLAEDQFDQSVLKIVLTRQKDETLSLQKRVAIAEASKADLFISLHVNSAPSSQVSGMEFFFKKNDSISKNESTHPTEAIVQSLINFGQTRQSLQFNHALKKNWAETRSIIKRAPYFVIERATMPSVLIEVGFISNLSEAKKLMTDDYQNKIAQSVINAIVDYKTALE